MGRKKGCVGWAAINLNLASVAGSRPITVAFQDSSWTEMIQRNGHRCARGFTMVDVYFKLCFLFWSPACVCLQIRTTGSYPLINHISCSILVRLPLTCLHSQSGMKTGWHLTKGINHPWPKTNYPSLPTLWPPLRGAPHNNSVTWKSAASQNPNGCSCAPASPQESRPVDLQVLQQHTHKRGSCSGSPSVTSRSESSRWTEHQNAEDGD